MVANHPDLPETIPVLAWKGLHPETLSPRQTGMVAHLIFKFPRFDKVLPSGAAPFTVPAAFRRGQAEQAHQTQQKVLVNGSGEVRGCVLPHQVVGFWCEEQ